MRRAELQIVDFESVGNHLGKIEQGQHVAGKVEILFARCLEVVVKTPRGNGDAIALVGLAGSRLSAMGLRPQRGAIPAEARHCPCTSGKSNYKVASSHSASFLLPRIRRVR